MEKGQREFQCQCMEDNLCSAIIATSRRIVRHLQHRFEKQGLGINMEQFGLLKHLWDRDGQSQQELSRATQRDRTSTTRLIDTMERKGLLQRKPHEKDRRIKRIFLTSKGKSLQESSKDLMLEALNRALGGIPQEQITMSFEVLDRVEKNLE